MRNVLLSCIFSCSCLIAGTEAGGVQWKAPGTWKALPDRPMRAGTYSVPAASGDPEAGEMAIFFFGPGQGGSVEANIQRWIGQFQDVKTPAKRATQKLNGFSVTTIELAGTYLFSPTPMSPEKTPKPGYRMVAAIVDAPDGPVFFKFTAPAKTVAANEALFQTMLKSIAKK